MVIEYLTFTVTDAERDEWLDVEAGTWTRFLERQAGFVGKQVWVDREESDRVHAVITWTDEESWKSIPRDELGAIDEAMGEWFRPATLRVFDVLRST